MSRLHSARLVFGRAGRLGRAAHAGKAGGAGRAVDGKEREEKKGVAQKQFPTTHTVIIEKKDKRSCREWSQFYFASALQTQPAKLADICHEDDYGDNEDDRFPEFLARWKDRKLDMVVPLWTIEEEIKDGRWKLRAVTPSSVSVLRPTRFLPEEWKTTFDTWFEARFSSTFDSLQPAPILQANSPYRELISRHRRDWLLGEDEFEAVLSDMDAGPLLLENQGGHDEPYLWKNRVFVPDTLKLPVEHWNMMIFESVHLRPETPGDYFGHIVRVSELYKSRKPLTLPAYFRLIQRTAPSDHRIVEIRTADAEHTAAGGTWLKLDENPPFVWLPSDRRTLRDWDVELIYGFPVVHTLLRNEWATTGNPVPDVLTKPVGLDSYVAHWRRLDAQGKIYHNPVLFQWPALPWPNGGAVFLDPIPTEELLGDRCINDRDYISQEDWKSEADAEPLYRTVDTLLLLKLGSGTVEEFPNKGHCWKRDDLLKSFETAKPTFGWVGDGYMPTRRYYHIPYPDVWIDRASYLRYRDAEVDWSHCWLLVPNEDREESLGTRDGMLGVVSSMHGDERKIYSMYPHRRSFEYELWFPEYVKMLGTEDDSSYDTPTEQSWRPLFRGVCLAIWQEILVQHNRPDLRISEVGDGAIASKIASILAAASEFTSILFFDLIDLVWRMASSGTRMFPDWLEDESKRRLAASSDTDDVLNALWRKTRKDASRADLSVLLLDEIKRMYAGNYCAEPYTSWIPLAEIQLGVGRRYRHSIRPLRRRR